jgi:hypothetical protein
MSWNDFYTAIGMHWLTWAALPTALLLPWAFKAWRKSVLHQKGEGSLREGMAFFIYGVLAFLMGALMFAKADYIPLEGFGVVVVYLLRAGIPIYLLWMIFRELIDAYFD